MESNEDSSQKRATTDSSRRPSPQETKKQRTDQSSEATPINSSSASASSSASPWIFGNGLNIDHGWESTFDFAISNGLEPWGQLVPRCALLRIFSEVVKSDGIFAMLYSVGRMNSFWNNVCKEAILWKTLDLSFGWIKKDERVLEQIIKSRNLSQLREIDLDQWKGLTNSGIQLLADNCPKLTSVKLSGTRVNSVGLSYLVKKCSDLNSVDLSALKTDAPHGKALQDFLESRGGKVRSLNMSSNCLNNFNMMMKLISTNCSQLRVLDVSNVQFASDLVMFDIELMQNCCSHLQILRVANAPLRINIAAEEDEATGSSPGFPELQELDLGISGSNRGIDCDVPNNFLHRILKTSESLKVLDLRGSTIVKCQHLESLPVTDLQRLYLSSSSAAKYEGIEIILTKWQHSLTILDLSCNVYPGTNIEVAMKKLNWDETKSRLEEMDLSSTQISCARVQSILSGFPRLCLLNLSSCQGLPRGVAQVYSGHDLDKLRRDITAIVDKERINPTRSSSLQNAE